MKTESLLQPFSVEDRQTRELVRDLHTASPAIYWTDLLLSAAAGCAAFALAVALRPFSVPMLMASCMAAATIETITARISAASLPPPLPKVEAGFERTCENIVFIFSECNIVSS